ncbi:MAG: Ldh family oxidoreductase [Pseudomonadota bacterium]
MSGQPDVRRVDAEVLRNFIATCFSKLDVPDDDATAVAGLMVEADLLGLDTHGSFRLRQYVNRLRDGGTNAKARPFVVQDKGATGVVDGDNGLGHLGMVVATTLAMRKADEFGIGWVGVRNNNHAGPATLYVQMPMANNQIAFYAAVGSANHVPPWGGADLLLGTNPIAIAVPAGKEPGFVLDMATTVAAAGKIKTLAQRGEQMPIGWMVGRDGLPLTDPTRQKEGLLLPIGGPKGYGLAMAIGLLAGTLNGAAFGRDVVDFSADTTTPTNTGQFIAAISVSAFGDVTAFQERTDAVFQDIKTSAPLPGYESVRVPGDQRRSLYDERRTTGIPLHDGLIRALDAIAGELRVARLAA